MRCRVDNDNLLRHLRCALSVPDVWVEPKFVVPVLADEIIRLPVHTAVLDEQGRGLALRVRRVVGFIRDDKSAEGATTMKEIAEMFSRQRRSDNRR